METILAIETSVPEASLCLWRAGECVLNETFTSSRGHNTTIFAPLAEALRLAENNIDQIIVGTGPGSYSGTRIGIAAAQGVAIAQDCNICGLGSLAATEQARAGNPIAIGDARRGLYYSVEILEDGTSSAPDLMDADALRAKLSTAETASFFTLDDPQSLATLLNLPDLAITSAVPHASRLVELWLGLETDRRAELSQQPLMPTYLRAPFTSKAKPGHPLLRG